MHFKTWHITGTFTSFKNQDPTFIVLEPYTFIQGGINKCLKNIITTLWHTKVFSLSFNLWSSIFKGTSFQARFTTLYFLKPKIHFSQLYFIGSPKEPLQINIGFRWYIENSKVPSYMAIFASIFFIMAFPYSIYCRKNCM